MSSVALPVIGETVTLKKAGERHHNVGHLKGRSVAYSQVDLFKKASVWTCVAGLVSIACGIYFRRMDCIAAGIFGAFMGKWGHLTAKRAYAYLENNQNLRERLNAQSTETLAANLQKADAENTVLRLKLDQLEKKSTEAKPATSADSLRKEMSKLRGESAEKDRTITDLQNRLRDLAGKVEELPALKELIEKQKFEISSLKESNELLRKAREERILQQAQTKLAFLERVPQSAQEETLGGGAVGEDQGDVGEKRLFKQRVSVDCSEEFSESDSSSSIAKRCRQSAAMREDGDSSPPDVKRASTPFKRDSGSSTEEIIPASSEDERINLDSTVVSTAGGKKKKKQHNKKKNNHNP